MRKQASYSTLVKSIGIALIIINGGVFESYPATPLHF